MTEFSYLGGKTQGIITNVFCHVQTCLGNLKGLFSVIVEILQLCNCLFNKVQTVITLCSTLT